MARKTTQSDMTVIKVVSFITIGILAIVMVSYTMNAIKKQSEKTADTTLEEPAVLTPGDDTSSLEQDLNTLKKDSTVNEENQFMTE